MPSMKTNIAPKSQDPVPKLSQQEIDNIIKDVIASVRQEFVDDGAGEEALQRLLHIWYSKMVASQSPFNMPPGIPPPKDLQSFQDRDKNSATEPSSSSAASCLVKKEGNKEPVRDPGLEPKDVILKESLSNDDEIEALDNISLLEYPSLL